MTDETEDERFLETLAEKSLSQGRIVVDIIMERKRQDEKWGGAAHDKQHTVSDWVRFIHEHASKANEAASLGDIQRAQARLVEVAALAVAALEMLGQIEAYPGSTGV
jgi:hypothetical protein